MSMGWKGILRTACSEILYKSWCLKETTRLRGRGGIILGYHRVLPPDHEEIARVEPGMYVTTKTFSMQMALLRKRYRVAGLEAIAKTGDPRGMCAVTFDDGWRDTYVHAFPILRRYGIPATVFLITDLLGKNTFLWPERIAAYIHRGGEQGFAQIWREIEPALREAGVRPRGNGHARGPAWKRADSVIRTMKKLGEDRIRRVMDQVDSRMAWTLKDAGDVRRWMNWEEALEMASEGISFGSHTHTHRLLDSLGDAEIEAELSTSQVRIREELGVWTTMLCYPNGNLSNRVKQIAKKAGFEIGVTTEAGSVRQPNDPLALRRVLVHEDMTRKESLFAVRMFLCGG